MERIQLETIPFASYVLACDSKASKGIEKIYEKFKVEAYALAKESKFYNARLFCCGSLEKEIKCKMALGVVLLSAQKEQVAKEFYGIIKKNWGWLVQYSIVCKSNTEHLIPQEEFFDKVNTKDPLIWVGMYFLALLIGVQIELGKQREHDIKLCYIKYVPEEDLCLYDFKTLDSESKNKVIDFRNTFFNGEENIPKTYENILDYLYCHLLNPNIYITGLAEGVGVDLEEATKNITWTQDDLNDVFAYMRKCRKLNYDKGVMFTTGIYFKGLSKAYLKVKEEYFKQHKDTLCLQQEVSEKKIKELQDLVKQTEEEKKPLLNQIEKLKNEYKKGLEKENLKLKKEIEKLKKSLEESKANDEELFKLRNYIFEKQEYEEDLDLEEEIEIPDIKVIVIGGHESWVSRIKEELPSSFEFVSGFKENFDLKVLENAELVLFVTNSMAHSTYYRAKKGIKCPFEYISQGNVKLFKQSLKNLLERGN